MSEFRRRTLAGLAWSLVATIGRQSLVFVVELVLARFFLSPRDYGLFLMLAVVANYAAIFTDLGFSAALIQRKEPRPEHLSSVFWLNLAVGLCMTTLFAACAPLLAAFYGKPELAPMAVWVSLAFAIGSLKIVQNALLTRELNFRAIAAIDIASVAVAGTGAIVLASRGWGPWALVFNVVCAAAVNSALHWAFSPWRPSLRFDKSAVVELTGFSANYMGTQSLNYWARNLDNLLVGRFLGDAALGLYGKAYSLMLFPINNVSRVVQKVMFPAYASIQDDKPRVKRLYLRVAGAVALLSFPMMLGLWATAEPAVLTLFGERWRAMIPVLEVLALSGLVQSITSLNGNLFLSQGRADLQFRIGLILKLNVFVAFAVGLQWGIIGMARAFAVVSILNSYPSLSFAGRLVGLSYMENLRNLRGTFLCAATMAGATAALDRFVSAEWAPAPRLVFLASFGVALYVALVAGFGVEAWRDCLALAKGKLNRRNRGG